MASVLTSLKLAARSLPLLDVSIDSNHSVIESITSSSSSSSSSPRAVAVELDVTADGPTIEKSVQKAWDVFGHIHALVNNAGIRGM